MGRRRDGGGVARARMQREPAHAVARVHDDERLQERRDPLPAGHRRRWELAHAQHDGRPGATTPPARGAQVHDHGGNRGAVQLRGPDELQLLLVVGRNDSPMSEKYPMTPAGYAAMKAQLLKLKNVDRIANSRAIEIARGHGDLSENADYSAAKDEQGLIEARISELEAKIALAAVIDPTELSGSRVKFVA